VSAKVERTTEKEDLRVKLRDALVQVDQNRRALQDQVVLKQQLQIAEVSAHNLADRCSKLADALRDLLVLVGAKPIADLPAGTALAGCVERGKKALEGWS